LLNAILFALHNALAVCASITDKVVLRTRLAHFCSCGVCSSKLLRRHRTVLA